MPRIRYLGQFARAQMDGFEAAQGWCASVHASLDTPLPAHTASHSQRIILTLTLRALAEGAMLPSIPSRVEAQRASHALLCSHP